MGAPGEAGQPLLGWSVLVQSRLLAPCLSCPCTTLHQGGRCCQLTGLRCCSAMCLPSASWGGGKGLFLSRSPAGLKKNPCQVLSGGWVWERHPQPLGFVPAGGRSSPACLWAVQEAEGWRCMRPSSSKHKVSLPPLLINLISTIKCSRRVGTPPLL